MQTITKMNFISSANSTRSTGSPGQWSSREGAGWALDHPTRPPFPPATLPLSLSFSFSEDFYLVPPTILQDTVHEKRENARGHSARCNRLIQHLYAAVQKEMYGACHECNVLFFLVFFFGKGRARIAGGPLDKDQAWPGQLPNTWLPYGRGCASSLCCGAKLGLLGH